MSTTTKTEDAADFADELMSRTTIVLDWRDRLKVLFGWHINLMLRTKVRVLVSKRYLLPEPQPESKAWTFNPREKSRPMSASPAAKNTANR